MKLYLTISSLNIDNILSTECVAPLSFYQARTYGYNTFYGIELIPCKNILILFSKIPRFVISDREHDNRPVILEINVNERVNPLDYLGEHEGIIVYSTDTIIRLTPFNTRILFFNPNDLNLSRLSCSDSLTNKLGDRFRFELCKADFDLTDLSDFNLHLNDSCKDYDQKVLQDNRLNVVKGFVFGYYLGVSKSVSSYTAILLRAQKRIYDIVATLKNSGGYGIQTFYEELEQLDKEYRLKDPSTRKCKDLWIKTLEGLSIPVDSLDKLLEDYDEKNVIKNTFMKKNGFQPLVSLRQYGPNNLEAYRDNLISHTSNIIKEDQKEQLSMFSVSNTFDLDPSYETCMLAGEDSDSMMFNKFIDAVLWHGIAPTPETLRTNRFDIATQITISVKSIWESLNWEWQDSSAQLFMNELRQNIKSFTPFDVNKEKSIVLKSIAAFVLKGEDYDSIVQFCEDNSYSDYRYALALWGATQGYVKMSKPIISNLTKSTSFNNSYKAILTLLYNIESEGDLPYVQETVTIGKKMEDELPSKPILKDGDNTVHEWQNKIRSYLDQLKNVPKKKELYAPLENAFAENGDQMDYVKFFALLNDYKEWKTAKGEPIKAWKSMVEHFCPDEYARRFGDKKETSQKSKSFWQKGFDLFGLSMSEENKEVTKNESCIISIIYDENAYLYIEGFSRLGKHKNVIVSLFQEFQKSYQSGYYYTNSSQYRRNNNDVVDHFCKWCLSQKNKKSLPWSPENKKMIEELKEYLLKKYHD